MPSTGQNKSISLHSRTYRIPTHPTVVICVDGFDPEYLAAGIKQGITPTLARWTKQGFHATAKSAMPSVTNPNNLCIITGAPTAVHGISGNYYLDKDTGKEVTVVDDSAVLGSTILEQLADAGVRVAAITAKDKLRRIIGRGLTAEKGAVCFSSQFADQCTVGENGIEDVLGWLGRDKAPEQYSAELSLFVLDAGVRLLQEKRADVLYLTLSDYVQHKYPPGSPEANDYFQQLDTKLGELEKHGAIVAVTGDHGMSDKCKDDGTPNVLFLEDFLAGTWPDTKPRITCPIADAFVKHHGALGGSVRVHLLGQWNAETVSDMLNKIRDLPQVEMALTGAEAAEIFEMPPTREGEMFVVSKKNAVIGGRADEHDLSQLGGHQLRSHGGLSEEDIPLICSRSLVLGSGGLGQKVWRNFDAFDVALNH